jgi:hypothetical protein
MLAFPQLSSGAVAQLPLRRETRYRTLVNRMLDGSEVRVADLDYLERRWDLPLEAVTDAEWDAIRELFAATEGRLKSFLFLEPAENLLAWSEKFTEDVWVKSGVAVTEGVADPFGGTDASQLTGSGTLSQTLAIPCQYRYAGSIWARTAASGASLEVSDGAGQVKSAAFATGGAWRRYSVSTAFSVAVDTLVFRVTAPGGAVDIYGAQLEAQPAASAYKRSLQQGGVHPGARFASDTLADRATGPGEHAGVIGITWTPSQT